MKKQYYPQWNETVYSETLPNGLPIYVVPRPGFTKKLCYFVTDYGSIHTAYQKNGEDLCAPDGVAHFLEHKMFDLPGRDVSAEFAALGARPNAFTSYDMTAYYFSCTENFDRCLRLLLEFVSTPYFTAESVQKEQGIIGQEIGMSADNPDSQSFELLMQAMYENHPIKTPILGSRASIAQITEQTLYDCHKAFYRPDNMLLCVVGDVDPEAVKQAALELLPDRDETVVTRQEAWEEVMTPKASHVNARMEVAMPMFHLGFKCPPLPKGAEAVRMESIGDLAAEALFGESSALYQRLYEQGLIDGSFGGGFETASGMALLLASGDSEDPEAVKAAILSQAEVLLNEGIAEKDFLRMKRSALGRRIRDLDSFDSLCFRICAYHFSGYDYFRFPEVYQTVTAEDVYTFIRQVVTPERACLCVIDPTEQEET